MLARQSAGSDVWLRHILAKNERCELVEGRVSCGTWHTAITKSIRKDNSVEISGRRLSRITNGITAYAIYCASNKMRNGVFYGVAHSEERTMMAELASNYDLIEDPLDDDDAHCYLRNRTFAQDAAQFNVAYETLRLHDLFSFAACDSTDLQRLESAAGKAA